jgi:hypothetical protein
MKSICLTLISLNKNSKLKKLYQISNCRFRLSGAILVGIRFNTVQNVIVNNENSV